jgi:hypothetical protein
MDFEKRKRDVGFETYFERASGNNPIRSSIPLAVKDAQDSAHEAKLDARRAVRTNYFFASIGFLAILGIIVTAINFAASVIRDANQAGKEAGIATVEARRATSDIETLRKELDATKQLLQETESATQGLRQRLDQLLAQPPQKQLP